MMTEIDVVQKITYENKKLRDALEYYADPLNWSAQSNIGVDDRGDLARQVLRGEG